MVYFWIELLVYFSTEINNYTCAEQYMMAEKARIMGNEATRAKILKSDNPEEVKALDRKSVV